MRPWNGCAKKDVDKSNWGGKRIKSKEVRKAQWTRDDAAGHTSQLIKEAVLKVEKRKGKVMVKI